MRKIVYILFLLLPLQHIVAADKAPLYILDGQYIEQQGEKEVEKISPEDIATIETIDSATAVSIYGERASGGVVVVRTKKFEDKHYKKEQPRHNNEYTNKHRKSSHNGREIMAIIIIAILSFPLSKLLVKWQTKCRLYLEEKHIIKPKSLPSYLNNAESVQFKATSSFAYYIWIILLILLFIFFTYMIFSFLVPDMLTHKVDGVDILMIVIFSLLDILFLLGAIALAMYYKWHLTIDEKGIRGMYLDYNRGIFFPKFTKVNIRWKYVSSAELVHTWRGRAPIAGLAIFYKSAPDTPKEIININLFSSKKIIDSANYYYALHQEHNTLETKELMEPYQHNDDEKFMLFMYAISIIILLAIYFVIF